MLPLARWLVRSGVSYGTFASALKEVFVSVAHEELLRAGRKATDSAVSVLSGVHRKDLRAFNARRLAGESAAARGPSLVSQVVTRWMSDPLYVADGVDGALSHGRDLPRAGPAPSFETLARAVSTDVHPRTLLDELLRLGVVTAEGDQLHLVSQAFVPSRGYQEMAAMLSASTSDHLAAAVHNLSGEGPKFLEQSVFADGLSAEAADELATLARRLWSHTFQTMVAEATTRTQREDAPAEGGMRMRFGTYYYHEAAPERPPQPTQGTEDGAE